MKSPSGAEILATKLHATQTDKSGAPYIHHLAGVVAILLRRWPDAPEHAVDAAWLHDSLEDFEFTGATEESLAAEGVSPQAIRIIKALSRPEGSTYKGWIRDLAAQGEEWTIKVKLADNEHNSDPARRIPGSDIVERRYMPAKVILEASLSRFNNDATHRPQSS